MPLSKRGADESQIIDYCESGAGASYSASRVWIGPAGSHWRASQCRWISDAKNSLRKCRLMFSG